MAVYENAKKLKDKFTPVSGTLSANLAATVKDHLNKFGAAVTPEEKEPLANALYLNAAQIFSQLPGIAFDILNLIANEMPVNSATFQRVLPTARLWIDRDSDHLEDAWSFLRHLPSQKLRDLPDYRAITVAVINGIANSNRSLEEKIDSLELIRFGFRKDDKEIMDTINIKILELKKNAGHGFADFLRITAGLY